MPAPPFFRIMYAATPTGGSIQFLFVGVGIAIERERRGAGERRRGGSRGNSL